VASDIAAALVILHDVVADGVNGGRLSAIRASLLLDEGNGAMPSHGA
jgi:hypothetical protein